MKLLKGMILGLFVTGLTVFFSSASFAEEKNDAAFIKLLKDSAAALQPSNPNFAANLTKFATEEENEKSEKEEKNEMKEKKEMEGMKGEREEHMKLLKDSAAALEQSHPDLAKELTKAADWRVKKMGKMEEKKEKEEMKDKK